MVNNVIINALTVVANSGPWSLMHHLLQIHKYSNVLVNV